MISTEQIELVQDSFELVLPITAEAATEFYSRLFVIAPDTQALFRHDMDEQGRKLFLTLATVVDALDRLETVLPVAEALAIRHVGYGVREQHYADVGAALIATLRAVLAHRFTVDTERAWVAAYGLLAECMVKAARTAARDVCPAT